jgi:hypothetical protein
MLYFIETLATSSLETPCPALAGGLASGIWLYAEVGVHSLLYHRCLVGLYLYMVYSMDVFLSHLLSDFSRLMRLDASTNRNTENGGLYRLDCSVTTLARQ